MNDKYASWANRRNAGGARAPVAPPAQHNPGGGHTQSPQAPPPGYAYVVHPTAGLVLVPLSTLFPQAVIAPPLQPPAPAYNVPYVGPPGPGGRNLPVHPGRPAETCMLVKPGDRDTYAELLATLPDLAPQQEGGYDSMQGRTSPESQAALNALAGEIQVPHDPPIAFGASHRPAVKISGLS